MLHEGWNKISHIDPTNRLFLLFFHVLKNEFCMKKQSKKNGRFPAPLIHFQKYEPFSLRSQKKSCKIPGFLVLYWSDSFYY